MDTVQIIPQMKNRTNIKNIENLMRKKVCLFAKSSTTDNQIPYLVDKKIVDTFLTADICTSIFLTFYCASLWRELMKN